MGEVAVIQTRDLLSSSDLTVLRNSKFKGFTDSEVNYARSVCAHLQLNPLLNQIHFVKRKNNADGTYSVTVQVGIDGFRLAAERTGKYAGSDDPIFEYRQGDTPRHIDWKASARVRRLVSREYRDERDQQVLLLLDCGRRMHARDGALSHLDHALNACLLLAHVALRQGDAVGLMSFGGVERYVPPRKSHAALNALLAASYDLDVTLHAPDYYAAAVDLLRRQSKRSLVVIVSNLRDEDDDSLRPALALLRRRHLVVLASLREHILDAALAAPVDGLDAALTHAATAQYLERRRRQFALLEESRVPCLDVEPQQLPIALVNRYTELKRRGAL